VPLNGVPLLQHNYPGLCSTEKAHFVGHYCRVEYEPLCDAEQGVVISLWALGMIDSSHTGDSTVQFNSKLLLENDTIREAFAHGARTPNHCAQRLPRLVRMRVFTVPRSRAKRARRLRAKLCY
jgi:hypothetical protein